MRKLTNSQIVSEAYQSAVEANTRNLPRPPMNSDGSFKSLRQLASGRKMREYEADLADRRDTREDPADYDYSDQGTGQNKKAVGCVLLVAIPLWILFFTELAKEIK